MRVLIIDHKDSFTFNLAHLIESCGASVEIVNHDQNILEKAQYFEKILLSPGPGLPEDYPHTLMMIHKYMNFKDILGICLGLQAIAVALGAKLFRQDEVKHGQSVQIIKSENTHNSVLYNLPPFFEAALYHSWAVEETSLDQNLHITSKSKENIIMGLKHKNLLLEGVQFHPESFLCGEGKLIIQNWLTRIKEGI